jgi:hypothetical protein
LRPSGRWPKGALGSLRVPSCGRVGWPSDSGSSVVSDPAALRRALSWVAGLAIVAAVVVALSGCGSTDETRGDETGGSGATNPARVDRCTERIMRRLGGVDAPGARSKDAGRYVRQVYCARFERRGWVYDDGMLKIAAHESVTGSTMCSVDGATAPCAELEDRDRDRILDCALLHYVRKGEAQAYVRTLQQRHASVECDDGTPLERLGAR